PRKYKKIGKRLSTLFHRLGLLGIVMARSPRRHYNDNNNHNHEYSFQDSTRDKMSILAMHTPPPPHSLFRSPGHWDLQQPSPDCSRPRTESQTIALPPIRQTIPELQIRLDQAMLEGRHLAFRSPTVAGLGSLASPEYVHSPNASKRRRVSMEDESSHSQIPRLYRSPERTFPRQLSSPRREVPVSASTTGTWASPTRSSPLASATGPGPIEISGGARLEPRPMMPGVVKLECPPMTMHQQQQQQQQQEGRGENGPETPHQPFRLHDYSYAYHHHHHHHHHATNRHQSFSALSPSGRPPHERAAVYHPQYPGEMVVGGDAKQRKRRGNLPKETTDKLRAWFVAHLHHPYPTEEEKQELMRQTGLQMNQISNWFINARRRQLPAMMNSVRAESEVMRVGSSSSSNGGGIGIGGGPVGGPDLDYGGKGGGLPLSDGEGCAYDDDMRGLRKRRAGELSRESV
ncbi:hypothetical protein CP532_4931, partial [Ophiocordyceps camponoti-leonardi (nom. inval.)]